MSFTEYIYTWVKNEVLQGRIMIGIGVILIPAFIAIMKGEHGLLKGSLIPLGLLLIILIGYGSFILYSRPAHAKISIELFEKSETEGMVKEKAKHISDNKAGNTLLKVYPVLMLVSVIPLFFGISDYYKGLSLGFILLFISVYIIDYGFVSRSNNFISFLNTMTR